MKKRLVTMLLALSLMGTVAVTQSYAQQAGGGGGGGGAQAGGGAGGGGRGGFDPAQFRQRMQERMKTEMAATDDEWKVLQPKIEKVQTLQAASRGGGFGGGMGGGRRNRGGNNADAGGAAPAIPAPAADASAVVKATYDLRVALENKDTSDADIKAKVAALRDAKTKAKDELTKAQKELQEVASVRQEAVMVRDGLLE